MSVTDKIQALKTRAADEMESRRARGPKRPPLPVEPAYNLDTLAGPEFYMQEKPAKISLDLGRRIVERLQAVRNDSDPFNKRLQRLH